MRKKYPSDLLNEEWEILEELLPKEQNDGRPRKYELREIVGSIWPRPSEA